jgi:NAD(P)-dependent dehydrogenase (short-subunit alcohol dehydrogenase family)
VTYTYRDLAGRVVLLTGGANGIGATTVRAFHRQGARVCFCDIDVKAGRRLAHQLKTRVAFSPVDLEQESEICDWIRQAVPRGKAIDILVNNAARDPRIDLAKTTVADWDKLMAVNLRAHFITSREAAKRMKRGSTIINFSSITFYNSPPRMSAYVATKAGLLGFTRCLARELGPRGIRVNVVSPGWIMTERQLRDHVDENARQLILRSQCIPELLQPEDIADVVLFLASQASRALTGQEILADRGWHHS